MGSRYAKVFPEPVCALATVSLREIGAGSQNIVYVYVCIVVDVCVLFVFGLLLCIC